MHPPARSIRREFRDAIALGIRESGPKAVSILLIGSVRLLLAVSVVLMLHLIGAEMLGFSLLSIPFAALSILSSALMLMSTVRNLDSGKDESEASTLDERRPNDPSSAPTENHNPGFQA
jgi:hypothetical protein